VTGEEEEEDDEKYPLNLEGYVLWGVVMLMRREEKRRETIRSEIKKK